MTDIGITTRGIPEAIAYINQVGYMSQRVVGGWIAHYLVGDESGWQNMGDAYHGLSHYVPYKYVTPFRSYSSDPEKAKRQRGWIFTHLDQIGKDNRTGATANAWKVSATGANAWKISNRSAGAWWTMGDSSQTQQSAAVGWRKKAEVISSNMAGAIRYASQKLAKMLKGQGE